MTLATWKKEFYPKRPSKQMTTKQAIEHSIRKWEGLRKTNLKKHKVDAYSRLKEIGDENSFFNINAESCALCVKFFNFQALYNKSCDKCPLKETLGLPCDDGEQSPYQVWRITGNPVPMIKALKKTLKENS